jgi:hypothetical protein
MPCDLNTASLLHAVHGNFALFLSLTHTDYLPISVLAQPIPRASVIYQILPSPTPVLQGQLWSVLCLGQLRTSETPDLVQLH